MKKLSERLHKVMKIVYEDMKSKVDMISRRDLERLEELDLINLSNQIDITEKGIKYCEKYFTKRDYVLSPTRIRSNWCRTRNI